MKQRKGARSPPELPELPAGGGGAPRRRCRRPGAEATRAIACLIGNRHAYTHVSHHCPKKTQLISKENLVHRRVWASESLGGVGPNLRNKLVRDHAAARSELLVLGSQLSASLQPVLYPPTLTPAIKWIQEDFGLFARPYCCYAKHSGQYPLTL